MREWCKKWGWATDKTGQVPADEKSDIIAFCHEFGQLPPMHKNVRRHYHKMAERDGWYLPLSEAVGQ